MTGWFKPKHGPIGIDIGSRSVKLAQFNIDRTNLLDLCRWDLTYGAEEYVSNEDRTRDIVEAINRARQGRGFRGKDAVICVSDQHLFMQNIRVAGAAAQNLQRHVHQEAAGRLPYSVAEAEIRFIDTDDVRQGEQTLREVILLSCHRPILDELVATCAEAGMRTVAIDFEPAALVRSYASQFRRDDDRDCRVMYVHFGYSRSLVVISQSADILFVKYIDVGGQHLDDAVAQHLAMSRSDASALRRHNGDRRSEQQNPEIARSIAEGVRPVLHQLFTELSKCVRYHSVTFRGTSLARLVLGGGEATPALAEMLAKRLNIECVVSDPLRVFQAKSRVGCTGQWDIAAGLALREMNETK